MGSSYIGNQGKEKKVKETATSLFHRPPFYAVCDAIAGGVSQCMLGNSQVICFLGGLNTLGHRGIRARREKGTGELVIFAMLYISQLFEKQPDAVKSKACWFFTFF